VPALTVTDPPKDRGTVDVSADDLLTLAFETTPDFETLKQAIYARMRLIHESGYAVSRILLAPDIYEILNTRLVFKTAAHKELPHLITPYGNLLVPSPESGKEHIVRFQ
jgi:hypothetical protein